MTTWGEYQKNPKLFMVDLIRGCENMKVNRVDGGFEVVKHNICECLEPSLGEANWDIYTIMCSKCNAHVPRWELMRGGYK